LQQRLNEPAAHEAAGAGYQYFWILILRLNHSGNLL
jgi:hypothetical protein